MLETLIPIAAFLTQFFSEKLLEYGLDRVHSENVKHKLSTKIQSVLQESILDLPDGEYVVNNFDFIGLLQDSRVQNELSLLVRPSDNRETDIEVLQDAWERKLGNQLPGNYRLILEKFLRSLRQRIWEVEEIQPLLHMKEDRVFHNIVKRQFDRISSLLPSADENLNADIEFLNYKSQQVLNAINHNLSNGIELERKVLNQEFDKKFEKCQLMIIKGDAGAGKSAFAKKALLRLQNSQFIILAFKADVFTKDSLNELFPGFHNTLTRILDYLSQQNQVIVMIDSLEKLLEVNNYDAFKELLRTCKNSANIKIILTCRSFAYAQLMFDLHGDLPRYDSLDIPNLEETELDQVERQFPFLTNLFKKKSLRHLLRKPFYLNLLVTHSAITKNIDFVSEKDFRILIWDRVIAKGDLRRSATFRDIAVQRAISMSLFTEVENPDLNVIKELIADGIILADEKLGELYCPSHDIFEDIALIRNVDQIYQSDAEVSTFFSKLGGKEPAVRRAFRLWLNDQLFDASSNFSSFVASILENSELDQYWKDETIISILHSNYSKNYFDTNLDTLKTRDWGLFTRFIHILRTSCQEPDEKLAQQLKEASKNGKSYWLHLKPVGPGWTTVIEFIYNNLEHLGNHRNLIFKLIVKDWSKLLGEEFPSESVAAGKILLSILDDAKSEHDSPNKFFLSEKDIDDGIIVLFNLCSFLPSQVQALIQIANSYRSESPRKRENYHLRDFYDSIIKCVLSGLYGNELCKEFPDLVCEVAMRSWLKQEEHLGRLGGLHDIGDSFGLAPATNREYFPSGIYQTPVRFLLNYHPAKTLRFIVDIMNVTTEAYATCERGKGNGIVRIELNHEDGSVTHQLGDPVLWAMYRGSVQTTPYLLQSILMTLENWLFELCQIEQDWADKLVESTYSYLLKRSTSVTITAVLSSVAMAYPKKIGKTCLPILSVREFYEWDIQRLTGDQFPLSPFDRDIPFAQEERQKSNQLPHRKYRLETLVTKLQVGGYWNEINGILDNFRASVKPEENSWKLALNQMDFRKYEVDENKEIQDKNLVLYRPQIDEDLTDFVTESQNDINRINKIADIGSWSRKVFDGDRSVDNSLKRWRELLKEILELESLDREHVRLYADPPYLAAIGIRDFASDMTEEEKLWSATVVIEVIQEHIIRDIRNDYFSPMKFSPLSITPSIKSIPLILSMDMSKDIKSSAKITIFLASIRLRDHNSRILLETLRNSLWRIDQGFAESCFAGMLKYAKMFRKIRVFYLHNEESTKKEEEFYKKVLKLADSVSREKLKINISDLSFSSYSHWYLGLAVQLIPLDVKDELYRSYIKTLFMFTYEALNTRDDNQDYSDYMNTEFLLRGYLAEFLLHQDKTYSEELFSLILNQAFNTTEQINYHAMDFVSSIVEHLIIEEDKLHVPVFWDLLTVLENKITKRYERKFIQYLFLSIPWWNGDADDWAPLKNKNQYFRNLIITLGMHDIKSVIRLLSGIGTKRLLPDGVVWLNTLFISSSESIQELFDSDTFFYSEKLIQRVYNLYLREVKSNSEIKRSFLLFLDKMINAGSSLAFIVRERVISI